jgi:hypothetical protein
MAAKTTSEVWRWLSAKVSDLATAAAVAKTMVKGNRCNEGNVIVDDNGNGKGARATTAEMAF